MRHTESVCKLCRREMTKLFLKGDRCYTEKCAIDRRSYPPGQHGQSKGKDTAYAVQLREKQKIRRLYGIQEKQFSNYFKEADRIKGVTGSNLLVLLERRLDNIVYRLGFANSRADSRQLVRHGHITVNGKRVDVPSFSVDSGDVISIHDKSREVKRISLAMDSVERRGVPAWLELNRQEFTGTVKSLPTREDLAMPLQEQMVVEFYSR